MLKNPLFRRVVTNSGYLFSTTGLSAALGMLQGILVARLLGVDGYGLVGVITLFTGVVNNLVSFRMGELVINMWVSTSKLAMSRGRRQCSSRTVEMGAGRRLPCWWY
jgi:hypothetical protein